MNTDLQCSRSENCQTEYSEKSFAIKMREYVKSSVIAALPAENGNLQFDILGRHQQT